MVSKGIASGNIDAKISLAEMFYYGLGVAQDYQKAFSQYEELAKQGYASPQLTLGFLYENGEGVAKDYIQAWAWYAVAIYNGEKKDIQCLKQNMTELDLEKAEMLAHHYIIQYRKKT